MDINLPGINGIEATRQILAGAAGHSGRAAVDLPGRRPARRRPDSCGAVAYVRKEDLTPAVLRDAARLTVPRPSAVAAQRQVRGVPAAHAVHPATRRRARRAQVQAGHRRRPRVRVTAPAGDELAQVGRRRRRCRRRPGSRRRPPAPPGSSTWRASTRSRKPGREPFELTPRSRRSCRPSSRSAHGSTPTACACPAGARVGSATVGCTHSTNGRSGCRPARDVALGRGDLGQASRRGARCRPAALGDRATARPRRAPSRA